MNTIEEIKELENQIYKAMINSDINVIDRLISDDILFTAHTGQIFTKEMELASYNSGNIKVNSVIPSEQLIKVLNETTVAVSVLLEISGVFNGEPASGKFRFTRIWIKSDSSWQVVIGQSTMLSV